MVTSTTHTTTLAPGNSYVEWGAVIAGTVLACAISLILMHFGNGIGFSYSELNTQEALTTKNIVIIGLWVLWVQIMASMAGGYLAGRMRAPWTVGPESELRDGVHGLLVWATSTLVVAGVSAFTGFAAALAANHGMVAPQPPLPIDVAHKVAIISGFGLAASSLVSAVAAWAMGTLGGDHRDQSPDVSRYTTFRKKR